MNITEAWHALTTDSQEELFNNLEILETKVPDKNSKGNEHPIKKAINTLKSNMQKDLNGDRNIGATKRAIYESQIESLEQLQKQYETFRNERYTAKTNKKLKEIFDTISQEISEIENKIEDKPKTVEAIIENESELLEDTWIQEDTPRDLVEKHIDFHDHLEYFKETKEITLFLKLFTIEYINITRKKNKKIPKNCINISKSELKEILEKVGKQYKKGSKLKIDFHLKDNKETLLFRKYTEGYKESRKIEKEIQEQNKIYQCLHELGFIEQKIHNDIKNIDNPHILKNYQNRANKKYRKKILSYKIKKGIVNEKSSDSSLDETTKKQIKFSYALLQEAKKDFIGVASQKLLTQESENLNMKLNDYLKDNPLPESTQKLTLDLIRLYLKDVKAAGVEQEDKSIKDIIISDAYIKENKEVILNNMKNFIQYIIEIESYGGKKFSKNTDRIGWDDGSSAKGVFQIIDGYKGGERIKSYKNGDKSTFEVIHTYAKQFYEENNEIVPNYIDILENNPGTLSPLDLTYEQSMNYFLIYMFKKIHNRGMEDMKIQLVAILGGGNKYSMKQVYGGVHNTNPDKKTSQLMTNATKIVSKDTYENS